jgi:hypothetical protein
LLAKIVRAACGNNHLGVEGHFLIEAVADVVKQTPDIAGFRSLISYRKSRVQQRTIGKSAQEYNRVQKVRFADTVRTRNTGKWAKADVDIDKILKAGHSQSSQH